MFVLDDSTMDSIINTFHIPAKPKLLIELENLNKLGLKDLNKTADIIVSDVGLSGLILQTINTPLFGLNRQVDDIKKAVVALGFDNVFSVASACLIQQAYSGKASISLERFWDESVNIACLCKYFASKFDLNSNPEKIYTLGLFHNVGIAAMAMEYDTYEETLLIANQQNTCFTDVENKMHGYDHSKVGFAICESWGLPIDICQVICFHHDVEFLTGFSPIEQREMSAVLRLVSNLYSDCFRGGAEFDWPEIKEAIFDILELNDKAYDELKKETKLLIAQH